MEGTVPLLDVDAQRFTVDINAPAFVEAQLKLMSRKLASKLLVERHDPVEHLNEIKQILGQSRFSLSFFAHDCLPMDRRL